MRKYIIIYIFLSINIFAQNSDISIKSLVEKIKKANPEERRVLINELKIQLRRVNEENRRKSMLELRKSLNTRERGDIHYNRREHKHCGEGRRLKKMMHQHQGYRR